jgi:hypothetical protein
VIAVLAVLALGVGMALGIGALILGALGVISIADAVFFRSTKQ